MKKCARSDLAHFFIYKFVLQKVGSVGKYFLKKEGQVFLRQKIFLKNCQF